MLIFLNLVIVALALVLVLAIAAAASPPPKSRMPGITGYGASPDADPGNKTPMTQISQQTGLGMHELPVVVAAGLQ